MSLPRLFLVAPDLPAETLAPCLKAACAAGDVASLLVPSSAAKELTPMAQALGVAVLVMDDAAAAMHHGCDGIQLAAEAETIAKARSAMGKNAIIGAFAGNSRHFAMEAAESGADYVALSQKAHAIGGEPIVKWWAEFFEIPCVAFDPVAIADLDTLLPQNPDFIRPGDAMWESADAARSVIADLMQHMKA